MQYDSIIIGTGPAGLEAAINLKIRNKRFLLFGASGISQKIVKAPLINNYLGLPNLTGKEMAESFSAHLKESDIDITLQMVSTVYNMGSYFSVAASSDVYEAKTIILATGIHVSNLFKGEEEYLGRGVGYCATCDAPLYKGKRVAIIGYNAESENEANFVSELTDKVYFIPVKHKPTSLKSEIEVINAKVLSVEGSNVVNKLVLDSRELPVDGVFILRDSISPTSLLSGLATSDNHIVADADMGTNIPGCFAAGDCTGKPYQFIRAAGQGLIAAHSVVSYLANNQ